MRLLSEKVLFLFLASPGSRAAAVAWHPDSVQPAAVDLPIGVEQALLDLAGRCDLLLFGELHGTREVPALVAGLMDRLASLGYGGLGLEVPSDERQHLADWASGVAEPPPPFYSQPSRDGRGSTEALDLAKQAATRGLAVKGRRRL